MTSFNNNQNLQDVIVAGGGLAGLSLAIQLGKAGRSVTLYEKETYPFHRVCGEYISNESYNFLEGLGFQITARQLPLINKLMVSSLSGKYLTSNLDTGGFGVSRYFVDDALCKIAKAHGVNVIEKSKVS